MVQQELLALAKQGNVSAIATLINQASQKKGITATVFLKGDCLYMMLVSVKVPEESSSISFIQQGLSRLNITAIKSVVLYGLKKNEKLPAWKHKFNLNSSVTTTTSVKSTPSVVPQQRTPQTQKAAPAKPSVTPTPQSRQQTQVLEKKAAPAKPSVTPTAQSRQQTQQKSPTATQVLEKKAAPAKPSVTPTQQRQTQQKSPTATQVLEKKAAPAKPSVTPTAQSRQQTQQKSPTATQVIEKKAASAKPLVTPTQQRQTQRKTTATQVLEKKAAPTKLVGTNATSVVSIPETKPLRIKEKKKQNQKISLLVAGGTSWVAIAAGTIVITYQLKTQVNTPKKVAISPTPTAIIINQPIAKSSSKTQSIANLTKNLPLFTLSKYGNPNSIITLKAVGDMVPGTVYSHKKRSSKQDNLLFENVKPYLQGADILFGNFESTLTNYSISPKDTSRPMVFAFRTPPAYANLLKATGFNVLSIANNHSMDFAAKGFADTIANIQKAGMKSVGQKNQILYLNIKNTSVAFIGFSYLNDHNSMHNLEAAKSLVEEARKNAKIVVISVHAGAEGSSAANVKNQDEMFYGENRGNMILFAHTMIDYGADLILGHGPHVPRAVELYKGKLVAYSLGNFLSDGALSTSDVLSNSMILELQMNKEGDFITGNIVPVSIDNRGIPQPDNQLRSVQMLQNMINRDFPNTPLTIDGKGRILKK